MNKIKYFLFSDPHGSLDAITVSLETAGFDENDDNHYLICLGDIFDRGKQNLEVFNYLNNFRKLGKLQTILGNHDEFFKDYLNGEDNGLFNMRYNGMLTTVEGLLEREVLKPEESYYKDINEIKKKHPDIMEFLYSMVDEIKIGKYILTHGGYSKRFEDDTWEVNNWAKTINFVRDYPKDNNIYVFGHYGTKYLNEEFKNETDNYGIFKYDNYIGLDSTTVIGNTCNVLVIEIENNIYKEYYFDCISLNQ